MEIIEVEVNDHRFFACAGAIFGMDRTSGEVIVPYAEVEYMSNEEIGAAVRGMKEYCALMSAINTQDINWWRESTKGEVDLALRRFSKFKGLSQTVDHYLRSLQIRLDDINKRDAKREVVKQKRKELVPHYKEKFLHLGNERGFLCQICGANRNLTLDHIIPLSKGGTNDDDNLQILCRSCNSRKCDR